MRKFIITGGPCTGKTTLIELLSGRGFPILPESAREIMEEEQKKYEGVLPWTDLPAFQNKVFYRQKEKESAIAVQDIVFLDRGIPDILAYAELGGIDMGKQIHESIFSADYCGVFILDRLPCYHTDESRKESAYEAASVHDMICSIYSLLDLEAFYVPAVEPEKRLDFVLGRVS